MKYVRHFPNGILCYVFNKLNYNKPYSSIKVEDNKAKRCSQHDTMDLSVLLTYI